MPAGKVCKIQCSWLLLVQRPRYGNVVVGPPWVKVQGKPGLLALCASLSCLGCESGFSPHPVLICAGGLCGRELPVGGPLAIGTELERKADLAGAKSFSASAGYGEIVSVLRGVD